MLSSLVATLIILIVRLTLNYLSAQYDFLTPYLPYIDYLMYGFIALTVLFVIIKIFKSIKG